MEQQPFIDFYGRFVQFKQGHPDTWVEEAADFFAGEARRKWKRFPEYCKTLKKAFLSIPAFHERGIVEGAQPSMISFFLKDFFPLVQGWFQLATGIAPLNVVLHDARVVYEGEAMYLCQVFIPAATFKVIDEDVFDIGDLAKPLHVRAMLHFFFGKLIASLNPVFKTVANIGWQLVQLTNLLEISLDGMHITMLLSFNDYSGKDLQIAYFNGHLLEFIEETLGASPGPKIQALLAKKKSEFQDLARSTFINNQGEMLGAIKHFEASAVITGKINPLYEVLAALISKLDLGVTPVQHLLRSFNMVNGFTEQDTIIWGYLFELVVTQALLYETFKSNLTIFKQRASQVFMIILQYYLIDLGRDTISSKVFRGGDLYDKVMLMVAPVKGTDGGKAALEAFSISFQQFLVNHFKIQDMDNYETFIKCLFGKSVERLNSRFFAAFLKTSHLQVTANLDKLNENVPASHQLTYPGLVHRISEFLQFCLKEVIFKGDLSTASKQFKDSVSRFSEINVATAMVELLLYRELPFHENQWMATLAVEFRNKMDVAIATDVRDHFKAISPTVLANYIIHDRALKPTTSLLHEWFFTEIIEPFNAFHQFVHHDVSGKILDWTSFVVAITRFFKGQAHNIKLDARMVEDMARIVSILLDWQET